MIFYFKTQENSNQKPLSGIGTIDNPVILSSGSIGVSEREIIEEQVTKILDYWNESASFIVTNSPASHVHQPNGANNSPPESFTRYRGVITPDGRGQAGGTFLDYAFQNEKDRDTQITYTNMKFDGTLIDKSSETVIYTSGDTGVENKKFTFKSPSVSTTN